MWKHLAQQHGGGSTINILKYLKQGRSSTKELRDVGHQPVLYLLLQHLLEEGGDQVLQVPLHGVDDEAGDGRHEAVQLRRQPDYLHLRARRQ